MPHDPLCPARHKSLILETICTHCSLIRATRAEERAKQWPDPLRDQATADINRSSR